MKIVIAIDSFKGSASSNELALHIQKGIRQVYKESKIIICPIADGGEGTIEALSSTDGAKIIGTTCKDPLGYDIQAEYVILEDKTAVIEMASASGLTLVPESKRDPRITSTYGTGDLVKDAIKHGCRKFIIGIGGSATNDAGLGMLRSLGFRFLNSSNQEITFAKYLDRIVTIDKTEVLKELDECEFKIACDVNNPLFGENGAAYIYGGQKGADALMIEYLDKQLKAFAALVEKDTDKKLSLQPGAGAAGGLGFGFLAFLNSELKSGIKIILEQVKFEDKIKGSHFVITGEGKIDKQSTMGKVLDGIGTICKKEGVICIALTGNCDESVLNIHEIGITSVFSIINSPISLKEAMNKGNTLKLIQKKSEQIFRLIKTLNNDI
jgi:glycerate kinase